MDQHRAPTTSALPRRPGAEDSRLEARLLPLEDNVEAGRGRGVIATDGEAASAGYSD